ncbi:MAG: hypothetical protein RQ885_12725 [Desulfurococcales archaeon]|nr:hypothetical protein [Desulfurococcales archaeon]
MCFLTLLRISLRNTIGLRMRNTKEPRYVYPTILLHNIHVVCHDVITRVSSLRKSRVTVTDIDVSSTC